MPPSLNPLSPARLWPRRLLIAAVLLSVGTIAALGLAHWRTEEQIQQHHLRVLAAAQIATPTGEARSAPWPEALGDLPAPVQRYLRFAFPGGPVPGHAVQLTMEGQFRRPGQESFHPTSAHQTAGVRVPALMFDARTPMAPGVWARAWDAYVDGRMEMKARILSALTVVDETGSPQLDRISLRRWLLESPTYPQALLPGGAIRWEPVDTDSARAVISHRGQTVGMRVRFGPDGGIASMAAEEDGDLGTPYHGSGEHVRRNDYQLIGEVRIPTRFVISRAARGQILPFWDGRITQWQLLSQP